MCNLIKILFKNRNIIIFWGIPIIVALVGMLFSYIIAINADAPGFVLIGSTAALAAATFIYGIGEIISQLRKKNEILTGIQKELANKKES